MPSLLYPAYQKFYSALTSLERFRKEADFFDNISCLDLFFSEYRNVTFAIQSQLKHTNHFSFYEEARDRYLTDHWFVEKRNETIKQQPFRLVKRISLSVYTPSEEIEIVEQEFTTENDIPLSSLYNEIKEFFDRFYDEEIFFSTSYSFFENGSSIDLFVKIKTGIESMKSFLDSMDKEIGEACTLCEQLKDKIKHISLFNTPADFFLTDDYVYYKNTNDFEKANRIAMITPGGSKYISRAPINILTTASYVHSDGTPFGAFTGMNAILRLIEPEMEIMPALLVVYGDDTFDMDVFQADIKTTIYRKINEIAKSIAVSNIREVCFMTIYAVISVEKDMPVVSRERIALAHSEILVIASVDSNLNEKEYVFEGDQMGNAQYIYKTINDGFSKKLSSSRVNLSPILRAFKSKQTNGV